MSFLQQREDLTVAGPWKFTLTCPQGHPVTEEGYDERNLRKLLRSEEPLRVYCASCDEHWDADPEQRSMLRWALGLH